MSLVRPREYEFNVCMEAGDYARAQEIAQTYVNQLEEDLQTWVNKLGEAELQIALTTTEEKADVNDGNQ